jgi:hypothetical protein
LAQAGQEWNVQRPVGRPDAAAAEVLRREISVSKQWSILFTTHRRRPMRSATGVNRKVSVKCLRCDVTLSVDRKCFLTTPPGQIPDIFQAVQLDLTTQNWGLSWKCKEEVSARDGNAAKCRVSTASGVKGKVCSEVWWKWD